MESRLSDMMKKCAFVMLLQLVAGLQAMAGDFKEYYKEPLPGEYAMHQSHYDYADFARKVTKGCKTNYDKIKAIYKWICNNISYDTSYQIYSADECVDKGKGVCQAYCELFFHLAKAVDVDVEIISGYSKDRRGNIDKGGHAWLFAYTRANYGFLLDPTWGAGTVENKKFYKNDDCWVWFDVDPEWMILSHLPKNQHYQLVKKPVSSKEFSQLTPVSELWLEYGLDVHEIYEKVRSNSLSLPEFFTRGEKKIELVDFPRSKTLRVGEFYPFRIRMKTADEFNIINGNTYCKMAEWSNEGNGVYSVSFMPRSEGDLVLCLKGSADLWNTIIKYGIKPPTQADWNKVEMHYPLDTPDMKRVKNVNASAWKRAGIDERQLLRLVREQQVTELPNIFDEEGQQLQIVSVPMDKNLKAGQSYTFSFYPKSGVKWAMVNNDDWHNEWTVGDDGLHQITVAPAAGSHTLYVMVKEGGSYWSCIEYEVR